MSTGTKRESSLPRRVRNRSVVLVANLFGWVVPRLSLEFVQRLGAVIGRLGAMAGGKRRRRVRDHLRIAFPPGEYDDAFRERILKETYKASVQVFFEALWVSAWNPGRDDHRVRIQDQENWDRTFQLARERNVGLLIYTAHLGTPEVVGRWFAEHSGVPVMAVAARPKIRELEAPMIARRESGGLKLVFRGDAGTATYRHLKRGGALISFVDHNLKGEGVAIPFFGRNAHTLLVPAKLALQSGAVANTLFLLRDGLGRFVVRCGEPIIMPPPERDPQKRLLEETRLAVEYTRRIEALVREYPEQYLWMHKRWQERSDTLSLPSQPSS